SGVVSSGSPGVVTEAAGFVGGSLCRSGSLAGGFFFGGSVSGSGLSVFGFSGLGSVFGFSGLGSVFGFSGLGSVFGFSGLCSVFGFSVFGVSATGAFGSFSFACASPELPLFPPEPFALPFPLRDPEPLALPEADPLSDPVSENLPPTFTRFLPWK